MREIIAGSLVCLLTATVCAADPQVDYTSRIKPLLKARCYACHGALKQEGGLRLDTAASAIRGGDSGPAIVPGDVEESLIWLRVSAADESERMPPEGEPLKLEQLEQLRQWISERAVAPVDETPERDPREHWAFQKPVRPAVPIVRNPAWQRNPIDAFLGAELESRGLQPQGEADRRVWLRRVTLDLTGLPPSVEDLNQFVADDSPDAYDRVVTRLLESPQYGERWGRHWMDIWRYSDGWGLGKEIRNSHRHLWHWRDWIIESLNADKGYDEMVREMLAADELFPNDLDRLRATGFLARQYFKFNRTTWLDGAVEHTSKAFLGLTTNCAKCHDHMYDPISQREYYQMRAIFEPYQIRTDFLPGELNPEVNGIPRAFDCNLDTKTYVHIRGDDRRPDESAAMEPGVPAVLLTVPYDVEAVSLPPEAYQPGLREAVVKTHRRAAEERIAAATTALAEARQRLIEAEQRAVTLSAGPPVEAVQDHFTELRPERWQPQEGNWTFVDGKLVQTEAGNVRGRLRYRPQPPADFEATLRYIPTGGDRWKSVGITFDVTESGNEILAYVSADAGGPKSQVAYRENGRQIYPAEARQSRAVTLNEPHELTLRVRDDLVNVLVDGKHSVAYQLPLPRQAGALELITYDATAIFQSFELRPLPDDVAMQEPESSDPAAARRLPKDQARVAVAIAEKSLERAKAELASVLARAAADRAKFLKIDADDMPAKVAVAVRAERQAALARAEEELARAELAVMQAIPAKREAAEKQLAAARTKREEAAKSLEEPGDSYPSLAGASKTPESNVETEESRTRPFPAESSGRRAALARWLTHSDHPLTARVAVNHIWSRHMGRPLVPTVFDFGRNGTPPTHPQLLDWLAIEFQEQGWSQKHLHRLIVTSQAYRRTSSQAQADPATVAADPENRWYWRANSVRMEAQVIRDSLLQLAGELDLTQGGPSIAVNQTNSKRRSLYFIHSHNDHEPFLVMFDDANVLDCYRRSESIVPQQALALENSSLASSMAEKIAARIDGAKTLSDEEFIRQAFLTVLSVEPTADEMQLVREMLPRLVELATVQKRDDPVRQGRVRLVQALLNHNDFVTIR